LETMSDHCTLLVASDTENHMVNAKWLRHSVPERRHHPRVPRARTVPGDRKFSLAPKRPWRQHLVAPRVAWRASGRLGVDRQTDLGLDFTQHNARLHMGDAGQLEQ